MIVRGNPRMGRRRLWMKEFLPISRQFLDVHVYCSMAAGNLELVNVPRDTYSHTFSGGRDGSPVVKSLPSAGLGVSILPECISWYECPCDTVSQLASLPAGSGLSASEAFSLAASAFSACLIVSHLARSRSAFSLASADCALQV